MVFLDILAAFLHLNTIGSYEPYRLLDLREIVFQRESGRRRRAGVSIFISSEPDHVINPVDATRIFIVPVVTQFVHYIEDDQQAGGDAQCETQYIKGGKALILKKIAEGGFKIIF